MRPVHTTHLCGKKRAAHLIFIPRRCHSLCSFNGFRHLACHAGNAEHGPSVTGRWTAVWFMAAAIEVGCVFLKSESKALFRWRACWVKGTPLMWLQGEQAKNSNGQLPVHICGGEPLWRSIRAMLTSPARTIGFPAPRGRKHWDLVNLESCADADFYLSLCDCGRPTDSS